MVLGFLTEKEQKIMLPYLQEIHLEKGGTLFRPGDTADGVFFLTKGQLGVQTKSGFEDKQQVVALLDPGAPVGEKGAAESGERGMTVVAIKDAMLLYLNSDDFEKIERSNPDIAIKILKKMLVIASLRLQSSSNRLAHVL
jgi:CRP/FNR family cyclic AMP-dependent transcriptional regulator